MPMGYSDSLSKHFLSKNLLRVLSKIEPVKTPILSNLFRVSTGSILPQVKFEVYERSNEVLPGVYPGNHAYRRRKGVTTQIITKEGIELRVSDEITAAELNFFKEYDGRGLPETIEERLTALKNSITYTREVLCAKALSGKITHKVALDNGGYVDYEVTFGTPLEHVPDFKWNEMDVEDSPSPFLDLRAMSRKIEEESGFAGAGLVFAGYEAIDAFIAYMEAKNAGFVVNNVRVTDFGREINIGGFRIIEFNSKYIDVGETEATYVLDPKDIVMVNQNADFVEYYSVVNDLDAGPQPVPMFPKSWRVPDPSSQVVLVTSKPLPVVHYPKAICWATVVADEQAGG